MKKRIITLVLLMTYPWAAYSTELIPFAKNDPTTSTFKLLQDKAVILTHASRSNHSTTCGIDSINQLILKYKSEGRQLVALSFEGTEYDINGDERAPRGLPVLSQKDWFAPKEGWDIVVGSFGGENGLLAKEQVPHTHYTSIGGYLHLCQQNTLLHLIKNHFREYGDKGQITISIPIEGSFTFINANEFAKTEITPPDGYKNWYEYLTSASLGQILNPELSLKSAKKTLFSGFASEDPLERALQSTLGQIYRKVGKDKFISTVIPGFLIQFFDIEDGFYPFKANILLDGSPVQEINLGVRETSKIVHFHFISSTDSDIPESCK